MSRYKCKKQKGVVLVICMIFLCVFSTLALSLSSISGSSVQVVDKQCKVNKALSAAQSGLECGRYIVANANFNANFDSTPYNTVSDGQADSTWTSFCTYVRNFAPGGQTVAEPTRFTDSGGDGDQIIIPSTNFGSDQVAFEIRFYRYDINPQLIKLQSIGTDREVTRSITLNMDVTKDNSVLHYAVASRGRMWLTGESTIHGDIFSSWDRPEISPFNMTSDSRVNGTINTVLAREDIENEGYQLETLDENGNPIDTDGNPLGTNYEDRYYGPDDEIQGYHENINYDQPDDNQMPGMDIDDYDTDEYKDICLYGEYGNGNIPSSETIVTEYFPHAVGDYTQQKSSSSRELDRHVYENQTFTNVRLPDNRNALFKNCTFEGVLYIDCYKSASSYYNNVRFDNCTFNGTIVTDVPQSLKWKDNALYFTGEANFNNTSDMQEATILAPHFNVNLGNTNPEQGDNNIITGAIVGGIVDVRGNAQIYGTIISMADTTQWSSGYVTNIGATLDDGGSETTEPGDIGVIDITPDEDQMLPSGITSPIVIVPDKDSYSEGV